MIKKYIVHMSSLFEKAFDNDLISYMNNFLSDFDRCKIINLSKTCNNYKYSFLFITKVEIQKVYELSYFDRFESIVVYSDNSTRYHLPKLVQKVSCSIPSYYKISFNQNIKMLKICSNGLCFKFSTRSLGEKISNQFAFKHKFLKKIKLAL
jgi:hypothetical protein